MVFSIISKTLPYLAVRTLAYFIMSIIMLVYGALSLLIMGWLISAIEGSTIIPFIAFIVFLGGGLSLMKLLKSYILYMVKAGHVAVISEIAIKGDLPQGANQFEFGKEMVKNHFASSNVLFVLDNLMKKAVKETQKKLNIIDNWFSFIPGIKNVTFIIGMFIGIVLNYVDEAILGYIFQKQNQSAWKSAVDGVVLYVQNWKTILKSAAKIVVLLLAFYFVTFFISYNAISALISSFKLYYLHGLTDVAAIILTFVIVAAAKGSILDPMILTYMICKYLDVSINSRPSFDLHEKIKGISKSFTKLIDKATENAQPTRPTPAFVSHNARQSHF